MTKKELFKYKKYFTIPSIILEIFKDEDIIPTEIIHLIFYKSKPKDYVIMTSSTMIKEINKLITEEYEHFRNKSKKL